LKEKTHKVCKIFLTPDALPRKHYKFVPHNTMFSDIHRYNGAGITRHLAAWLSGSEQQWRGALAWSSELESAAVVWRGHHVLCHTVFFFFFRVMSVQTKYIAIRWSKKGLCYDTSMPDRRSSKYTQGMNASYDDPLQMHLALD
jgi:hypothetical protein